MERIIKILTGILASVVCGGEFPAEDVAALSEQELEKLIRLGEKHGLSHMLTFAFSMHPETILENNRKKQMEQNLLLAVFQGEQMGYELENLCKTLEAAGILHIPLKGAVIRNSYPEAWMRTSCDIDILVKEADLQRTLDLLIKKGYQMGEHGRHDVSLYSPTSVHLELHFALVEQGRANGADAVLRSVWEQSQCADGWKYRMEMDDSVYYFYHLAHMAKHVEIGGCGMRTFLDLWILEHQIPHDQEKRTQLLKKGGLLQFADCAKTLAEIWFSGANMDPVSQIFQSFVITGGIYGSDENRVAVQQQKRGGKIQYALSKIFLPYEELSIHYPIVKKHKVLLPAMELCRWCKLLVGGFGRSLSELRLNFNLSQEQIQSAEELLKKIGL